MDFGSERVSESLFALLSTRFLVNTILVTSKRGGERGGKPILEDYIQPSANMKRRRSYSHRVKSRKICSSLDFLSFGGQNRKRKEGRREGGPTYCRT